MSDGNEFQRNDAATGNVGRPTLLLAGMVARAVGSTMPMEVGDVWAGRRHEPADAGMVARDNNATLQQSERKM